MVMKPLEISMMSKPSSLHVLDVAVDRLRALGQHVLDEPAGGDQDVVVVAEVDELLDGLPRHQAEGAAGELQDVHVGSHRLQDVLQVALAHRRVVGAADLGHAAGARFGRTFVDLQKGERPRALS